MKKTVFLLMATLVFGCTGQKTTPPIPKVVKTIDLFAPADAPASAAVNAKSGHVYIINGSSYVSVLRPDQSVVNLPVGLQGARKPIRIDEERDWVYVVNQYGQSVSVIRGTEVAVTLDIAGNSAGDIALSPKTGWAYIPTGFRRRRSLDEDSVMEGNVTVISGPEIIDVIPLGRTGAIFVEVDPIEDYVYVGAVGGDVVVLKDLKEVGRHNVGATVTDMDVDPNSGDVYVAARPPGGRELFRFRAGELVQSTGVTRKDGDAPTFQVHPTSGDIYMLDHLHHEVIVIRDMEVIERIRVGWHAGQLDIDPLTGNVYVLNTNHNTVSVIHGTEVLVTLDTGWYPYGIDINPTNGRVYITNSVDDTITVLGFEEE